MTKQTVGAIVYDALSKENKTEVPVLELQQELQKDYYDELINCVLHAQKKRACFDDCNKDYCIKREAFSDDFYIEVITIAAPLMDNKVYRFKFIPLLHCPTPNYDQSLFFYNHKKEQIEYLWTIPDRGTCYHLIENRNVVSEEEKPLLAMVIDFASGELFKKCKQLNGEMPDSPLLIKE